jgi:hypothetical protein
MSVNLGTRLTIRVTVKGDSGGAIAVDLKTDPAEPNGYAFQGKSNDYDQVLTACLKNLLADFEE